MNNTIEHLSCGGGFAVLPLTQAAPGALGQLTNEQQAALHVLARHNEILNEPTQKRACV